MILQYYPARPALAKGCAALPANVEVDAFPPHLRARIEEQLVHMLPAACEVSGCPAQRLIYDYVSSQESILMGVQPCLRDGHSEASPRALVLMGEAGTMASLPPILFWNSPIWREWSAQEAFSLNSTLEDLPLGPSLEMWGLIAEYQELFYSLMCAVIHRKHIIIIGTDAEVALWVAAVTWMLPPSLRPLLSFATGSPSACVTSSVITGMTSDVASLYQREVGRTCFMLDPTRGTSTQVVASSYAARAASCTSSQAYMRTMRPLFSAIEQENKPGGYIDEVLDCLIIQ